MFIVRFCDGCPDLHARLQPVHLRHGVVQQDELVHSGLVACNLAESILNEGHSHLATHSLVGLVAERLDLGLYGHDIEVLIVNY